ncbi:SDR family NAD(P)-dependent oxidoreductase [Amycolatopsis pithecellobii]|uniref:SDR family oxidoreductase n=1 Tax=Amycolatopsis pithecellobii TaxID=664692 RepID=A0A6N7Z0K3_9PSEU|nr:SDR family NAD(P)-dependent oxidoreductase [Amycolatopsis pithecellobii]MTD53291.1 SDR family oxidoreductase [Amycolatopsis pithecellobii]
MSEFAGRAAFVTGAGSGIGRAISLALAARGAFVWATDFDEASANGTAELIEQTGGHGTAVRLDVRHEAEWQTALALADSGDDALAVLVNCAGTFAITDTFSMPLDDFRRIMAVNVEGTFLGMKHAIPRIAKSGGGAVINISSLAGLKGMAGWTAYCGSKGATRMMTKAVALECAGLRNNVRVNSVHPGFVDTPALRKSIHDRGSQVVDPDEIAKTSVPIGVACSPAEVADTVCFLASDAARHITGAEIPIDGGMTAG